MPSLRSRRWKLWQRCQPVPELAQRRIANSGLAAKAMGVGGCGASGRYLDGLSLHVPPPTKSNVDLLLLSVTVGYVLIVADG